MPPAQQARPPPPGGRGEARFPAILASFALAYEAALAHVQIGEMRMRISELEADWAAGFAPAAAHLGDRELEPVRHGEAGGVLVSRDRVADRLAPGFHQVGDLQASLARAYVDLELDVGKNRIVDSLERRGKHLEHCGAGRGVLAAQNPQQRLALGGRRALIDDDAGFAFALMDGPGPRQDRDGPQPLESGRAVVSLVDLEPDHGAAVPICRQGVELAGATVGAIAIAELSALDPPARVRHGNLLRR